MPQRLVQDRNRRHQRLGTAQRRLGSLPRGDRCLGPSYRLSKSCIAISANTPPVIEIGANRAVAATSALDSMIWSILLASLLYRGREDKPADMAPQDRAHAHRARFSRGVQRRALQRGAAMRGETAPDRNHLAVRGRIVLAAPQIAAARQNAAVAHDHGAKRKIRASRLLDRDAHE